MDRVKEILYHDGIQIAGDNRRELLQSVTQYVDHERGGKTNPNLAQAQEDRMRSSMFGGSGQQMKQKAWDILLPEGVLEAVNVLYDAVITKLLKGLGNRFYEPLRGLLLDMEDE